MFGFLRRRKPGIGTLAALGTDMHAHWLPGLDDGAPTMEDSLLLIRELTALGYQKLIATPHVMADLYRNSSADIRERLAATRQAVTAAGITVDLDAAAEYLIDEGFTAKIEGRDLLTLPGNHVLVEYSFVSPPPSVEGVYFKLQSAGYVPILAHPERYRYYHNDFAAYRKLVERGVKLQVNLLSLTGYYGQSVKQVALQLIEQGLVSILGTDAHHPGHLEELRKLVGNGKFSGPIAKQEWDNGGLFR